MNRPKTRYAAFLALLISILVAVMGAAFADEYEPELPPFPDPRFIDPQLLVTPSDNLVSGQTVQVTGRRFGAQTTGGTLQQCTADLTQCEAPRGSFTTGFNGEFNPVNEPDTLEDPQTIPVPFVVQATFVSESGQTVDCRVTACVILAERSDEFETLSAAHHISFASDACGPILTRREALNAELDKVVATAQSPSQIAAVEAYRAAANARYDQELAAAGCTGTA